MCKLSQLIPTKNLCDLASSTVILFAGSLTNNLAMISLASGDTQSGRVYSFLMMNWNVEYSLNPLKGSLPVSNWKITHPNDHKSD